VEDVVFDERRSGVPRLGDPLDLAAGVDREAGGAVPVVRRSGPSEGPDRRGSMGTGNNRGTGMRRGRFDFESETEPFLGAPRET
jgi:hypothetical protein